MPITKNVFNFQEFNTKMIGVYFSLICTEDYSVNMYKTFFEINAFEKIVPHRFLLLVEMVAIKLLFC